MRVNTGLTHFQCMVNVLFLQTFHLASGSFRCRFRSIMFNRLKPILSRNMWLSLLKKKPGLRLLDTETNGFLNKKNCWPHLHASLIFQKMYNTQKQLLVHIYTS